MTEKEFEKLPPTVKVSTHMPLARHDFSEPVTQVYFLVSTHMPLARHDRPDKLRSFRILRFYSHASCEA